MKTSQRSLYRGFLCQVCFSIVCEQSCMEQKYSTCIESLCWTSLAASPSLPGRSWGCAA